ncbi:MAG: hypothetical protein WDO71_28680 [Bacteroidota bacterium]
MQKLFVQLLLSLVAVHSSYAQTITTKFERSGGKETPTYSEIIDWWQKLDQQSGKVKCCRWE